MPARGSRIRRASTRRFTSGLLQSKPFVDCHDLYKLFTMRNRHRVCLPVLNGLDQEAKRDVAIRLTLNGKEKNERIFTTSLCKDETEARHRLTPQDGKTECHRVPTCTPNVEKWEVFLKTVHAMCAAV